MRRALPLHNTAAFLPPPPRGRTIVLGAGKAGGSMAQAVEALWPADAPLEGLVVTRYHHIPPRPEELKKRIEEAGGKSRVTVEMLKEELLSDARLVYQAREEALGPIFQGLQPVREALAPDERAHPCDQLVAVERSRTVQPLEQQIELRQKQKTAWSTFKTLTEKLNDAARAAMKLPETTLNPDGPIAFWGWLAGGGHSPQGRTGGGKSPFVHSA